MSNGRRSERRAIGEPINICTDTRKNRAGIARDLSTTGVRFQSRSRFAIGERVDLMFRTSTSAITSVTGRVVRTPTVADYTNLFPHTTAVEFDAPVDLVES